MDRVQLSYVERRLRDVMSSPMIALHVGKEYGSVMGAEEKLINITHNGQPQDCHDICFLAPRGSKHSIAGDTTGGRYREVKERTISLSAAISRTAKVAFSNHFSNHSKAKPKKDERDD